MSRTPAPHRRNPVLNLATGLRRMAPGSMTGQFLQAAPARPHPKATVLKAPPFTAVFSQDSAATGVLSGPHPVPFATPLHHITLAAGTAASSSSVLEAYVDGSSIGTVTLPAGDTFASVEIEDSAPAGSNITVQLTTVGTGLTNPTATVGSRG